MTEKKHINYCLREKEIAEIQAIQTKRTIELDKWESKRETKVDNLFDKINELCDKIDLRMEKELTNYARIQDLEKTHMKIGSLDDRVKILENVMAKIGWWAFGTVFAIIMGMAVAISVLIKLNIS